MKNEWEQYPVTIQVLEIQADSSCNQAVSIEVADVASKKEDAALPESSTI